MPNPVAVNDLSPISGSLQTSRISYAVETAGKDYGQDYNGTTWYSDIPQNGSQYTIISDNYTANYYVSRSNAEGAYVEGGLPAVDEYSAPVFWLTAGTSSLDIITIVNGLPDRRGQIPFNSGSQALNWIASSSNYFAVGPPYEQIDADELVLYLQGNQVISYPTTGSSWYDISGYGTNGTLINGPTFNSSLGTIFLDGVDDFVTCSITNIAPTTFNNQDITFEILCNTTTNDDAYHTLMYVTSPNVGSGNYADITLGQWRNGLQNGSFYWQVSTLVQSYLIDSSTTYTSTNIATGKFFHVVGTWSKNGASYTGTLYVNGTSVASSNSAISTYTASDATKVYIGSDIYNSYRQGNVNNSKIYSKALTAAEVTQNYYGGPIVTGSLVFAIDAGNLVSYPKSGTAVYTLTGSVNGTLTNGPTFNPTFDGCWNFDGTDDYIQLGSSITPGNGNWTLSAWVRGYGEVVGNTSGGPIASTFGVLSSGGYKIFYANYDGSWNYHYGNTTLNPNTWYLLTWVNYAGASAALGTMKMYINGSPDSSVFNSYTTNGGPVDAVGYSALFTGYFNGNIASVQWNIGKAFTDAEVLQQYNATK
jgi:hypothetical protein